MMYLASTLRELLQKQGLKPIQAAARTNIDPSHFSRWLRGKQTVMSDEHYDTLCSVLFKDALDQAKLLRARLLEQCRGKGSDLIDIQITDPRRENSRLKEFPPSYKLPASTRQDLAQVAQDMVSNPPMREIIHGLARICSG